MAVRRVSVGECLEVFRDKDIRGIFGGSRPASRSRRRIGY